MKPISRRSKSNMNEGGLLGSEVINRANPVLLEDDIREAKSRYGAIHTVGEYVRFFDAKDAHLRAINSIINNSPTNRSIIRQKATMVVGDGLIAVKGRPNTLFKSLAKNNQAVTDTTVLEALDDKLSNVNAEGQSLLDVIMTLATDFVTYGNAYFCMAKAGKEVFCYAIPFAEGKVKKRNDDGEITHIGVSKEWDQVALNKPNDVQQISLYPAWEKDKEGIERTIVHLKEYAPGFDYYGLPEWISALLYAEMEYRIAKFNTSKFDNSFVPSGVLNLFGAKTDTEAQALIKRVKDAYTGTGKNGGLLVQVLRDESYKAHFVPLEDKSEGAYLELARVSAQAVVTAHRWTMSLAGFATKGQLGSNEQIRREFEIAQNTVIYPIQQLILRKCANVFMAEIAGTGAAFKGVYLDLANATPVSFVGDIDINATLTDDEKRQLAGYEPLPKSQQQNGNTDTNTNPT